MEGNKKLTMWLQISGPLVHLSFSVETDTLSAKWNVKLFLMVERQHNAIFILKGRHIARQGDNPAWTEMENNKKMEMWLQTLIATFLIFYYAHAHENPSF